jgi:hypothetical protein
MTNLVNTTSINTVNYLKDYSTGKFRFIAKCRAGFMTVSDAREFDNAHYIQYPESLLTAYKKGAIQTIEFCPDGGEYYLTVFAKKGNKIVLIDETILANLTVGTINQLWSNTNLYNQSQYTAVNAKTWADLAYVRKDATVTDSNREPVILENL